MRIAHINFWPNLESGLERKIEQQGRAISSLDLNMDIIVLNETKNEIKNNVEYRKIIYSSNIKLVQTLERKTCRYSLIEKSINLDTYDAFILRYPGSDDLTFRGFLKRHGKKLISEHHTNELGQLESFNSSISNSVKYILEKRNCKLYMSSVSGVIAVTKEIEDLENEKSGGKPSIVIPNGTDVTSVNRTPFIPFDGRNLRVVSAATQFSSWQGLDRVLNGIDNYSGDVHITLDIVGELPAALISHVSTINQENALITVHGTLTGASLDLVYANANLAIGVIALHRKLMLEACALKTIDLTVRGIPFISSYLDSNIPEDTNFIYKVPADDSPIDINSVIEFAEQVSKDRCTVLDTMTNVATNRLDWRPKMKKMYDFSCSAVTVSRVDN